jgi:hypothetical protein
MFSAYATVCKGRCVLLRAAAVTQQRVAGCKIACMQRVVQCHLHTAHGLLELFLPLLQLRSACEA